MNGYQATITTAIGLRRRPLIVTLMLVSFWSANHALGQQMTCCSRFDRRGSTARRARIAAKEVISLESSGSFGSDSGLRFDGWEMSVAHGDALSRVLHPQ